MDTKSLHVLTIVAIVFLVCFAIFAYFYDKAHPQDKGLAVKQKSGKKNTLDFVYKFYSKIPLFRKIFSNVKQQVKISYPADEISVRKQVTEILTKMSAIGIAGILLSVIFGVNDIYFLLAGLVVTYVICESLINNKLQEMQEKLLKQFSAALSSINHYYHEQPIVEDAIYYTALNSPYEIGLHLNRIYEIVDAPNIDEELNNYIGQEPNKFVLMFLSLCASVKDYGDKKMENGQSLFVKDLNYLQKELYDELQRIRKNKDAFNSLAGISLFALVLVKPAEYFGKYMDSCTGGSNITNYYNSIFGIIALLGIFVISIVINRLVIFLRDGDNETVEKDDDIFKRISVHPFVKPVVTKIINKNYTMYKNYDDKERGMGNHTGAAAFLTKQLVIAITTFVVLIGIFALTTTLLKYNSIHDFENAFNAVKAPTEEYTESMESVAKEYAIFKRKESLTEVDQDELTNEIMNNTDIQTERYASNIAELVIERVNIYQTTYFKFYALLAALGCAVAGFFAPVGYLKIKESVINTRKEEEVVRFQSLILILMHMGGMTTETILEWLVKFSYCFRESLETCIINSANGINKAIEEMKDEEIFVPFRDFCDNLLLIDKVGVEAAFEEVEVSRENFLENRQITTNENIKNRSSIATVIAYAPVVILVIFFILIPMLIMSTELLNQFSQVAG